MSIRVRYFASLKDVVGCGEQVLQVSGELPVIAVWQSLNPDIVMPNALLAAVNMEYVELDAPVKDGDELAFFPPVTGG
jgi:sulfur-carrier protein